MEISRTESVLNWEMRYLFRLPRLGVEKNMPLPPSWSAIFAHSLNASSFKYPCVGTVSPRTAISPFVFGGSFTRVSGSKTPTSQPVTGFPSVPAFDSYSVLALNSPADSGVPYDSKTTVFRVLLSSSRSTVATSKDPFFAGRKEQSR